MRSDSYTRVVKVKRAIEDMALQLQDLEAKLPRKEQRVLRSQFIDVYNELSGMAAHLFGSQQFMEDEEEE